MNLQRLDKKESIVRTQKHQHGALTIQSSWGQPLLHNYLHCSSQPYAGAKVVEDRGTKASIRSFTMIFKTASLIELSSVVHQVGLPGDVFTFTVACLGGPAKASLWWIQIQPLPFIETQAGDISVCYQQLTWISTTDGQLRMVSSNAGIRPH